MPAESRDLTDTVVAVTGASSGIGAATAQPLLDVGAKAAIQARRRDRLDALASKFGADNVLVVTGDVQNPDSATELVNQAVDRFGRLDSMVVNAGIGMYGGILDPSGSPRSAPPASTPNSRSAPAAPKATGLSTTTYNPKTSPTPSPPCYANRDRFALSNGNCGA